MMSGSGCVNRIDLNEEVYAHLLAIKDEHERIVFIQTRFNLVLHCCNNEQQCYEIGNLRKVESVK